MRARVVGLTLTGLGCSGLIVSTTTVACLGHRSDEAVACPAEAVDPATEAVHGRRIDGRGLTLISPLAVPEADRMMWDGALRQRVPAA